MANRSLPFLLLVQCLLLSSVSTEFNDQEKLKYVSCLMNFLNKLPQPLYFYEDGTLLNVQEFGKDEYEIEVSISAREFNDPEIIKVLKCKSSISNNEEDVLSVNTYDCHEEVTEPEGTTPYTEIQDEVPQVTEPPFEQHAVKLENEVQPDNVETSGEQFIAIPRPSPSAPCIGCASNVDVNAAGVHELAVFAVQHLDRHDHNNRHSLVSVTEVQRQVQVINGVRFILTLNIDFDNCSLVLNQVCKEQKTCRIGILEKPWLKHPDGSKFRAVVSNNCTDEWLFDEVLPSIPEGNQENKDHNETIKPYSSDDDSKKGVDTIIATHDAGLQSQVPTQESTITEEHLKDIQRQIITDDDKYSPKDANKFINSVNTVSKLNSLSNNNQDTVKRYEGITNKQTDLAGKADEAHASPVISNDKIKAIEDLMSYFQFDLKKVSNSNQNNIRIRRHYDTDIHGRSPMNKYYKMKRNADNAKYLYTIGQAMVDHLNEKEPQIKSRILKDVIKAEEEFGNNESFVYIQARVSKSCDKMKCNTKEDQNEICNAVINTSDHINPKIINVFCHFESMGHKLGKVTPVPLYDPILVKLSSDALKKIESESSNEKALKILKVLDASTQTLSGIVTKFTMEIGFLNCENTIPIWKRLNCTMLTDFGTMICSVIVHNRAWLKKSAMDYSCIDRPQSEVFDFKSDNNVVGFSDSKTLKMAQDVLENLNLDVNINYKPRVVEVTSVSTQLVAGLLTNINFTLGLTKCPHDLGTKASNCELLDDEPLRKCIAHIWERPWIEKGRLVNVTCDQTVEKVNLKYVRNRRHTIRGGIQEQDSSHEKFRTIAENSLLNYYKLSNVEYVHKVVKVTKASTQVVAGSLTRVDFDISPTSCLVKDLGSLDGNNCQPKNPSDIIHCHSEVWSKPWLPESEQTIIECKDLPEPLNQNDENILQYIRKIRETDLPLVGGIQKENPTNEKYLQLAEKSLLNYYKLSNIEYVHKVVKVTKASTQVVAGSLTRVDFDISPTSCLVKDLGSLEGTNCQPKNPSDIIHCHSEVWSRPWLPDGEQITIECKDEHLLSKPLNQNDENILHNIRKIRETDSPLVGGIQKENPTNEKYLQIAEKSLLNYYKLSNIEYVHKVVKVTKASTQVVAGSLTRVDFDISPTSCLVKDLGSLEGTNCQPKNPSDIIHCHSEVWSRPWLPDGEQITIECKDEHLLFKPLNQNDENILHNIRKIRETDSPLVGGIQKENPTNEKYLQIAEKSLLNYYKLSNIEYVHKVVKVTKASTQVVAGSLTRVDFDISPTSCLVKDLGSLDGTNCQPKNPSDIIHCHSEVWSRPWLPDGEKITIECQDEHLLSKPLSLNNENKLHNIRKARETDFPLVGGIKEENSNDEKYLQIAKKSLLNYYKLSNIVNVHRVIKVTKASTQVVAGSLTRVDFDISPTSCLVKDLGALEETNCPPKNPTDVLHCHSEVWSRPWLPDGEQITIKCNEEPNIRSKRNIIGGPKNQETNKKKYANLAEEALRKYELLSKSEYAHRVTKVDQVTTQVVSGKLTKIEFTTSQTICFANDISHSVRKKCNLQIPKTEQKCKAKVWERPWLKTNGKEVTINCYIVKQNKDTPDFDVINSDSHEKDITIGQFMNSEAEPIVGERSKRYTRTNEEEIIDEDTSYFYADRALKYLNSVSDSGNLYKLVSIYNTQNSYHMNVQLVRMYIEVALTYCTEASKPQSLDRCDEIEGVSHRMCLARAWPSSLDELILDNIDVVCDDELKFPSMTGISTSDLVEASLIEIEKSSKVKYKLVVKGEPKVIPSLESSNPTKLSFIVQSLTCHKNVSIEKMNTDCKMADSKPSRECISYIWLLPGENVVRKIKAFCIIDKTRRKRSVDNTNSELDLEVKKYIEDSIDKLEMSSLHRYKQKLLRLNNVSRKFTSGRVTTIDFHIGYTSCLKYEWVENLKSCEFVDHLPRRHCISNVWERLWDKNGNFIDVTCQDDQTPLEKHMNVENKTVTEELAKEALKHIEAKYPHPYKQRIVRILSLEKQAVAGIHYRIKVEVGYTDCAALTLRENCNMTEMGLNKFCSVNVWIRPWVNNGANVRVSCDYQESTTADIYLHVQAEHLFGEFVATYKPKYANDWSEMAKRFEIFKANVRKIQELNIHERGTATYGVTKFSDLTYEEFSSKYLGLKPGLRNENDIPMAKAKIPDVEVADKFDWRDHGAVTEVKNQGSCGSCWAFSVTGNVEGQWKLQKGELISLSEQELVDCDKLDEGCNGGLPDNAYRAIEELGGLETEDDYPYEAVDDKCAFNKSMSKVQISGAVNITTNETDMAKWLTKNGPISIGLNANAMQFYVGGISHPWKALCNPKNLDHGVLIVGYGIKDYPLFNKHLPYWTIKNSWGTSWGEQGYYRLYRGDGTCGVNQMASSAVV